MFVKRKLVRLEKAVSALCVILFLVSLSCSRFELTAKAGSAIIHVNPSESIQAAINNATEGDTILVSAGIYNESLQISKGISLIGQDTDQTIINGQNNQFIINITANNVTVEGFTIQSAPNLNPINGISVSFSKGGTIGNNTVMNSQQGITLAASNNNTIFDNTISNNQQGIGLSSSSNNTISNNVVTANSQGGILFAYSNNNFLSANTISNNSGQNGGIYMYASSDNVFSGNTVANNYPVGEVISYYCAVNTFYDNNFYDTF
jgi:parallel beta-helix repeat protein